MPLLPALPAFPRPPDGKQEEKGVKKKRIHLSDKYLGASISSAVAVTLSIAGLWERKLKVWRGKVIYLGRTESKRQSSMCTHNLCFKVFTDIRAAKTFSLPVISPGLHTWGAVMHRQDPPYRRGRGKMQSHGSRALSIQTKCAGNRYFCSHFRTSCKEFKTPVLGGFSSLRSTVVHRVKNTSWVTRPRSQVWCCDLTWSLLASIFLNFKTEIIIVSTSQGFCDD